MIEQQAAIQNYLAASADSFWRWHDRGEVAVWTDGRTIAFREELAPIAAHLAPTGLPPLGAILLLVAATRDNWKENADVTGTLAAVLRNSEAAWAHVDVLRDVIEGLHKVHSLSPELRTSIQAKAVLAEVVFEDSPCRAEVSGAVVVAEAIDHPLDESIIFPDDSVRWWDDAPQTLLLALRSLAHGLDRATPGRLKLRMQTSLDQLPGEADVELPVPLRVRALLAELKDDDELSGLAKIASRLLAAVSLPRPVSEREELQVGGVSDIINRGSLDKLLISELAHDDLTLAARVAMNEAMYLRRESPPNSPPRQRTMLLETGLRSWGVPRVYATAVAMALAATAERDADVRVFRAKRDRIEPVDLTTRDGLIAHLAVLESELHPGAALDAFRAAASTLDDVAAEPIIIASDDVLDDRDFQQAIAERMPTPLYLASVNREGRLRITERTARGSKPLKEVQIELDSLFSEPERNEPKLIDREWARDLPVIFSVEPFPLLLSHRFDYKRTWHVHDRGVLSITKDQRLMWWEKRGIGARQLSDDVPNGELHWHSQPGNATLPYVIVGGAQHGFYLLQCDLDHASVYTRTLKLVNEAKSFCIHNGVLFAILATCADVIDLETGEPIESMALPTRCTYVNGRFFTSLSDGQWYALAHDGHSPRFETVVDGHTKTSPHLLSMFESSTIEGLIGITTTGDLYETSTGAVRKIERSQHLTASKGKPVHVKSISPDGRHIALKSPHSLGTLVEVNVATGRTRQCSHVSWCHESGYRDQIQPLNLRHRFTRIGIHTDGVLALRSRKGDTLGFAFHHAADSLCFTASWGGEIANRRSFKPVSIPHAFQLSRASWDDGSEAFLDTRGLLHLRSSDSSIPEITIILTENATGGWCSDGTVFGRPYFTGKQDHASALHASQLLEAFVRRLV